MSAATSNYRFWENAFIQSDFGNYDHVITVDIAFNFKDPTKSLEPLLEAVDRYQQTHFTVIDHHSLRPPTTLRPKLNAR